MHDREKPLSTEPGNMRNEETTVLQPHLGTSLQQLKDFPLGPTTKSTTISQVLQPWRSIHYHMCLERTC